MQFIKNIQDCDDIALQLHAEIKRIRGYQVELQKISQDEWYPWAFGEVFATKWMGRVGNHNGNICVCVEGIYLIEPQTDKIWEANPRNDEVQILRL